MPLTIALAQAAMRDGQLDPVELTEMCLDRIAECDDRIRAWVVVDEQGARQAAVEARDSPHRGQLHGIPIGIKDIVDVAGMPTRAGSPLRENHRAVVDAPLVARLRAAGAVILGKTVTTEFACFDPSVTRNPWNEQHTPGGSSSGSAAATATQMCFAAIGSQTGGSITRPATYCGVAGLKPTFGAIDITGVIPVSGRLDHPGPIARTVSDLAVMWEVLADNPDNDRAASQSAVPPRLGVVREYFFESAEPGVRQATERAIEKLSAAGATIEPVALPDSFGDVHARHYQIMAHDAAKYHAEQFAANPELFGPNISTLLRSGFEVSSEQMSTAIEHQQRFRAEMESIASRFDAIIMPATDTIAPADLSTTGDPRFNAPWSYAGLPVVSLPCALVEQMPSGVQLVAGPNCETSLLRIAAWCEAQFQFQGLTIGESSDQ